MTPSTEDFDTYMRVSTWMRQQRHLAELAEGRYTIHYSNEGVSVSTEHGAEPMTDELWVQLGWVRTETGWTYDGTV